MEKLSAVTEQIMLERFGKDSLISLATTENNVPYVRTVNSFYEDGAFYVLTYALSGKMKQIEKNPVVAIAGDWFTAHGNGVNLGWFGKEENAEIAEKMKVELAEKVAFAGIVVEEVRITHLSYAEEIAAAMLQRQQAAAIIAARAKIVDGAVGMVKMALDKLNADEIVVLDEERKAQMVSNLLVVLCGNRDAQPIVNSGSLY